MKLNIPIEWFEKHITADGDDDAIAGFPAFLATRHEPESVSFGTFIALLRRRDGLSIEELAARAEVDASELRDIEADENSEPSVVHQLACMFHLPPKKLMQRAALTEPRSSVVREDAVTYAAHSASVAALSSTERELLDALVRELSGTE